MPAVVLLGPQRYRPTLADAFARVGVDGPVAAVTAGWEERENEIDELSTHLGRKVVNLRLYQRSDQIFERDPEFLEAWRERRTLLRRARDLHRQRMRFQLDALRRLDRRGNKPLVEEEREDALRMVRELDTRQLERVETIRATFVARWKPAERESVALQRERVSELLADCGSVAIAGGHVAVLINRLILFDLASEIGDRPLFAWSAGAMCASERIVIYHDHAPHGPDDALVLEKGLALCPGVIALPHAARRLDLDDTSRVGIFARRFAPKACVALDDASGLMWNGRGWELLGDGARRLRSSGAVTQMREIEPS